MKNRKKTKVENDRYRRYRKRGQRKSGIHTCKIGALEFDVQPRSRIHKAHELAKFSLLYDLCAEGHLVITEAAERGTDIRRDIVDLTDGVTIEIESDSKRALRHDAGVDVIMLDKVKWLKVLDKIDELLK